MVKTVINELCKIKGKGIYESMVSIPRKEGSLLYTYVALYSSMANKPSAAPANATQARGIRHIRDDVTSGTALAISIRTTGLFPTMLLQMTAIGEESGSLDDMLGKVADHYEAAVDNAVDSLSSLMEPMIMSILGVLVGGLMIAMYLPIFMLGSVI